MTSSPKNQGSSFSQALMLQARWPSGASSKKEESGQRVATEAEVVATSLVPARAAGRDNFPFAQQGPVYGPCETHGCIHGPGYEGEKPWKPRQIKKKDGSTAWAPRTVSSYTALERLSSLLDEEMVFDMLRIDDFGKAFDAASNAISCYEHFRNAQSYPREDLDFMRAALAAHVQFIRALARNFAPSLLNDFDFGLQSLSADFTTYLTAFVAEGLRTAVKNIKG